MICKPQRNAETHGVVFSSPEFGGGREGVKKYTHTVARNIRSATSPSSAAMYPSAGHASAGS